jgi:hypothetical protein
MMFAFFCVRVAISGNEMIGMSSSFRISQCIVGLLESSLSPKA